MCALTRVCAQSRLFTGGAEVQKRCDTIGVQISIENFLFRFIEKVLPNRFDCFIMLLMR